MGSALPDVSRMLDGSIRRSATGPVSVRDPWRRYDRFELWPAWSPQLSRVEADVETLTA
jgi:hypothetical protein